MKTFKLRGSAAGKATPQPRSKADKEAGMLSKTTQTFCQEWLKEQLYKRTKDFSNKYTEKGLIVEDNSIDFVAEQLGFGMLLKNEKHFEDDYFTGTPDVVLNALIIDVKNSFDAFTFPLFDTDVPNKDYYWQAQVYMELTGREEYKLIYTLMDTPLHLIEQEAYWFSKKNGYGELTDKIYQTFLDKMTFSDVPDELRIKVFNIKKNKNDIDFLKSQVLKCRNYLQTLNYETGI